MKEKSEEMRQHRKETNIKAQKKKTFSKLFDTKPKSYLKLTQNFFISQYLRMDFSSIKA